MFVKTCLMASPELLRTIDAVGIQDVPYADYTTLWVEKQHNTSFADSPT
jgi:hypothetical protein